MADEGSIDVVLVPWKINRHMRFGLLVDGANCGTLRSGRRIEVRTVPGPHSVGVTRANRGTYELDVEVPAGGKITLACSTDSAGLLAAQRSMITEAWDGPPPMTLWVMDDEDWRDDPSPSGWNWWIYGIQNQEALGRSPRPFDRAFYWLTIKHYVIWWLLSMVVFGLLLSSSLTVNSPWSILRALWSVMIVFSAALLILRVIARHRPALGDDLVATEGQPHEE